MRPTRIKGYLIMKKEFWFTVSDKVILLGIIITVALLTSCGGNTIDISKIVAERDSLIAINSIQKQELESLNSCVSTISNGLDSIALQEHIIKIGNSDGNKMKRAELKQSFDDLANLIARQRSRITMLEDSLKQTASPAPQLQKMISFLKEQLEVKENEIVQLKALVDSQKRDIKRLNDYITVTDQKVTELNQKNEMQEQIISGQNHIINTGYIKIGTKKQLKEAGIIATGVFSSPKLNLENLTPEACQAVDVRDISEITLNSKNPKILSQMPPQSYLFQKSPDGKSCTLIIKDPALFWSQSYYLVIVL